MRLALLANVNVNSLARRLRRTHDVYVAAGFGSWVQELVSADSPMRLFAPEVIILLLDGSALLKGIDPCDWDTRDENLMKRSAGSKALPRRWTSARFVCRHWILNRLE